MTAVGSVVGLVVGIFLLLRITSHRTVSAGFFTLAVFIAGTAGMIIYVGVKDGIGALLKRASAKTPTETEREPVAVAPVPEPEVEAEPAPKPVKATGAKKRRPPLRATLPPEPDDEEDEPEPPRRSVSARQRPLRPRD